MIYLSGGISREIVAACRPDLGLLLQPAKGNLPVPGVPFALDNGAFNRRTYDQDRWLDRLERLSPSADECLFAVVPDTVADSVATLDWFGLFVDTVHYWGYRSAFVSQDGATAERVPWDLLDCLFVGGTTAWKFSEPSVALIREAKRRSKWVHIGRVNSLRRLMAAHAVGADSADGTHLAFQPSRYLPKLLGWLDQVNAQLRLAI
jgi:hypothetical protein